MRYWVEIARRVLPTCALLGLAMPAIAADRSPTVVELFTSQGCSSCPPANANLIKISNRPDVLALSFSVTYWDYLGWKDIYGKPEFTERQASYEPPLHQSGPYTPQMVVNGASTTVGNRLSDVEELLAAARPGTGPAIALSHDRVDIDKARTTSEAADVWLVRYDPKVEEVAVSRGENRGSTLPHTHVVHALVNLGSWHGDKASFAVQPAPNGLRTAVLVQQPNGGPILSAATD